jgi:Protein of unknown function (DUF3276)
VDNERDAKRFESVYSKKVRAGKRRTYFFDVRRTRGEDFYLTLTESTKRMQGGYERHKIFLYKEDFNRFLQSLEETVQYIKTELMPQYDYDEFARRQDEYEARIAAERAENGAENGAETDVEGDDDDDVHIDVKPTPVEVIHTYTPAVASPPVVIAATEVESTAQVNSTVENDPELRALSQPTVEDVENFDVKAARPAKLDEDEDMSW